MRLTLRTLLAYLDDTLSAEEAKLIGQKVNESESAQELIEKIKRVTRRRGLSTPPAAANGSDANTVAEYLSDALPSDQVGTFELSCLESDVMLAEVAACHQILTLLLSDPVRVPPTARQRMYQLTRGPESLPKRKPGNAIPVGGVLPDAPFQDADDSDAAYLLGMKAYSRSDSPAKRAGKVLLLVMLVTAFVGSVCMVWPESIAPDVRQKKSDLAAVAVPNVPSVEPKKAIDVQPAKDGVPSKTAVPPVPAPTKKSADIPMTPVTPVETVPAKPEPIAPAKTDRIAIGKLETPDAVVLADSGKGKWLRIVGADLSITTVDRHISLPGYKSKIRLDSGAVVELWGNLPDQMPIPILESSVTFAVPVEGFAADIRIHTGRVYLTTKNPTGSRIRLRIRAEIWDVTLADDKSDVVVEVFHSLRRGMQLNAIDAAEPPQTAIGFAALKGKVKLDIASHTIPDLGAGEAIYWNSQANDYSLKKLSDAKSGKDSTYFSRYPVPASELVAKAVQQSLADLATKFTAPDSVRVRFAEMLAEQSEYTLPLLIRCRVGILGHTAIGDWPELVDALHDVSRPSVREAAIYGIIELAGESTEGAERLQKLLVEKTRCNAQQAERVISLLRGPNATERTEAAVLDRIVDDLNSPALAVREFALWNLKNEIDPESRSIKLLSFIDMAGTAESREGAIKAWKRRIEEIKNR